jgi:hypothetical protein
MDKQVLNSPLADLATKNSELIKNAEKITVPILLLGLILYFLEIKGTEFVLVIGCISAAITYFLTAFIVMDIENVETTGILNSFPFIIFVYKLTFLGLSVASVSVLSLVFTKFNHFEFVIVSGLTLSIALILSLITKLNDRSVIYNTIYYLRILPAILILLYLANLKYHWF